MNTVWLKIVDDSAVFASHFVHVQVDRQDEATMAKLAPYQVEAEGVVVYPEDDLQRLETVLRDLGLPYTVEQLTHDPAHIAKAQGVKYASRSECIEHLLNDKEPESAVVPNLRKQLAEKQKRLEALEQELTAFKQSLKAKGVV